MPGGCSSNVSDFTPPSDEEEIASDGRLSFIDNAKTWQDLEKPKLQATDEC